MNRREMLEWLSLAPADIPCWLALFALVGMYAVPNLVVDIILTVAAIGLSLLACFIGMRPDAQLSPTTNLAKKLMYPFFVLLVLVALVFHFVAWEAMREYWLNPLPNAEKQIHIN